MKIFGIFSLLYSLGYFTLRSMLPILVTIIVGNPDDIPRISTLISIFNLTYGMAQFFNGSLINRFGFNFVGLASLSCFLSLFFIKTGLSHMTQIIVIAILGFFSSAGTLALTFFTTNFCNSSELILGFLRLSLIILGGLVIAGFKKMLFCNILLIFQAGFLLSGVSLLLLNKKTEKKESKSISGKMVDNQFIFLCISGVVSAFPYFFLNGGFLNAIYPDQNFVKNIIVYISYGFGVGNLLVMLSKYVNFRKIMFILCGVQVICLYNVIFLQYFLRLSYFIIGISYVGHLLPVIHITKTYEKPIFMAGIYNFAIMFFSSFGLLSIFSQCIKFLGSSAINTYLLMKIVLSMSLINFLFVIYLFIKNRKN